MSGTVEGGHKAYRTNIERHGKDFYKIISSDGGKARVPKGFARMDPEKLKEISSKGGKNGSRDKF